MGALTARPAGEEERALRVEWALLRRVFGYFVPYWRHSLVVVACIGMAAGLDLVPAYVVRRLVDDALRPGGGLLLIVLLVAALVASSVAGGLVRTGQGYVSARMSQAIMYDLRNQLFGHLVELPVAFFARNRSGDLMSRLGNDVGSVETVISDT